MPELKEVRDLIELGPIRIRTRNLRRIIFIIIVLGIFFFFLI